MSNDFFTDDETRSAAYQACMGAATLVGYASGAFVAGVGAFPTGGASLLLMGAGTGLGVTVGKWVCPAVSERMLSKLRSPSARLSATELQQLVRDVRMSNPRVSRQGALDQLAAVWLSAVRSACT